MMPDTLRPTDPAFAAAQHRQLQRNLTRPHETTPDTATPPHLLGATVWYRSKTGTWTAPAIITATTDSLHRPNVDAGHVPDLTGPDHVHLTVLTPGIPGEISETTAETHPEFTDPNRPTRPAGGSFQEIDIPQWLPDPREDRATFTFDRQPAGTWTWPV